MNEHKRVLGIIYIATAALQILALLLVYMLFSTIFAFVKDEVPADEVWILELIFNILRFLPWLVVILISIPSIIAGFGLLNNKSWAMVLALILGCIKLFSFPIGTAIGVYAIWVYVESNKLEKLQPK